jgi:uroporphyrin-III C-methyltransferase/precorrin-2 dehydrogenase/sirohydrochlorin ferrochelatase
VLDRARRDAARIPLASRDVTRQLADEARRGRHVVRLIAAQSDHPGNEAAELRRAGVPVVIVPGVTAAADSTAIREAA